MLRGHYQVMLSTTLLILSSDVMHVWAARLHLKLGSKAVEATSHEDMRGKLNVSASTDNPEDAFPPGPYDVTQNMMVRAGINLDSDEVGTLKAGDAIKVLKSEYVESLQRVRCEIEHPHGWVTLFDVSDEDFAPATSREKHCGSVWSCEYNYDKCETDELGNCVAKAVTTTTTTTTNPAEAFELGIYDLTAGTLVTADIDMGSSEVVAELKLGTAVNVVSVRHVANDLSVRAEIDHPQGWITLLDLREHVLLAKNRRQFCASLGEWKCQWHYDKCWLDDINDCLPADFTTTTTTTTHHTYGYNLGAYDVVADASVTATIDTQSEEVGHLKKDDAVKVLRVEYTATNTRIRAEIEHPRGWISLVDKSDAFVWAKSRADFCKSQGVKCRWEWNKCYVNDDGACLPLAVTTTTTTTTNPADDFHLGGHDSKRELVVQSDIDSKSAVVGTVNEGQAVNILRVEYVASSDEVRAEIDHPHGWITLLDTSIGSERNSTLSNRELFCTRLGSLKCRWYYNKCYYVDADETLGVTGGCFPHPVTTTTTTTSNPALEFPLGGYDSKQDLIVKSEIGLDSTEVGRVSAGHAVKVLQVEYVESIDRVRAEIEHPHGWITLLDTSDGSDRNTTITNREAYCKSCGKLSCKWHYDKCYLDGDDCVPHEVTTSTTTTTTTTTTTSGNALLEFNVGVYDVNKECRVTEAIESGSSKVGTLQAGDAIEILKVELGDGDKVVRAEVKSPHGWITLRDVATNNRFATSRAAYCKTKYSICTYGTIVCRYDSVLDQCLPMDIPTTRTRTTRTTTTARTTTTSTKTTATRTTTTKSGADRALGFEITPPKNEESIQGTSHRHSGDGGGWIWVVGSFVTVLVLGALIKVGMSIAASREPGPEDGFENMG